MGVFEKGFRVTDRNDQDLDERYKSVRNAGMGVMIPGMLFGCVLVGCLLGYYIGRWLGHETIGLLTGLILGSVAGVREMLKMLKKMSDRKQ